MARQIVCAHPSHEANKDKPGWCKVIGTRDDLTPGRPVSTCARGLPMYCGACGDSVNANRIHLQEVERKKKYDTYVRAAKALKMTNAEAELIWPEMANLKD